MASRVLCATAAERGLVVFDRHIEKNGGTSFRSLLEQNEARGNCIYWGFQQRSTPWIAAMRALRNLTARSVPPRLCIEAHSEIEHPVPALEPAGGLVALPPLEAASDSTARRTPSLLMPEWRTASANAE